MDTSLPFSKWYLTVAIIVAAITVALGVVFYNCTDAIVLIALDIVIGVLLELGIFAYFIKAFR